jgi:hypothetical protein
MGAEPLAPVNVAIAPDSGKRFRAGPALRRARLAIFVSMQQS